MEAIMVEANTPTVALVHGAFADSSSWSGVIERLQARGVRVIAVANPLRGLVSDAAYLSAVLEETPGPVIAVGHSYGGAVMTNATSASGNLVGLVFVAAFAPDEGERLGEVAAGSKDSILMSAILPHHHAFADGGQALEFTIHPDRFHDTFAGDLPREQSAVLAVAQRPVREAAFSDASGPPAWRRLPSWAVIADSDRAAGTDLTRSMAERAGATITEVAGSHLIMVSKPDVVTAVILDAVEAAGARTPIAVG